MPYTVALGAPNKGCSGGLIHEHCSYKSAICNRIVYPLSLLSRFPLAFITIFPSNISRYSILFKIIIVQFFHWNPPRSYYIGKLLYRFKRQNTASKNESVIKYPSFNFDQISFIYHWLTSRACNAVATYASGARLSNGQIKLIDPRAACEEPESSPLPTFGFESPRRRSPVAFQLSHLTWKYLVIRSHCSLFEVGPSVFGFRGGTRGPGRAGRGETPAGIKGGRITPVACGRHPLRVIKRLTMLVAASPISTGIRARPGTFRSRNQIRGAIIRLERMLQW